VPVHVRDNVWIGSVGSASNTAALLQNGAWVWGVMQGECLSVHPHLPHQHEQVLLCKLTCTLSPPDLVLSPGISHVLSLCSDEIPRHANLTYKIAPDLPDKPSMNFPIHTHTLGLISHEIKTCICQYPSFFPRLLTCSIPNFLPFRLLIPGTDLISKLPELCDFIQVR
jgi:hypothetical protein